MMRWCSTCLPAVILLCWGTAVVSTTCFCQDTSFASSFVPSGVVIEGGYGHLALRDEHISDQKYAGSFSSMALSWSRFHENNGVRIGFSYSSASHISNNNVSAEINEAALSIAFLYPVGTTTICGEPVFAYLGPWAEAFVHYRQQHIALNPSANPDLYRSAAGLMSMGIRLEMLCPLNDVLHLEGTAQTSLLSCGSGTTGMTNNSSSLTLLTAFAGLRASAELACRYALLSCVSVAMGYRSDVIRIDSWNFLVRGMDTGFASMTIQL